MIRQTVSQKRSEVMFRDKLSTQHRGKRLYFKDEFDSEEMLTELKKRLATTRDDVIKLTSSGIATSPFLEIGAEYGVRSSLLMSETDSHGIAADIALTPLTHASWFAKKLHLPRLPILVCADGHHLPFADKSFAFVFCYQTLHHFPDPLPVIDEIYRVLRPGGYFFFAEEPVRQDFNLRLFRRPTKISGLAKFLKYLLILPFISEIGKTEVEHGIVEETFPLSVWKKIVARFEIDSIAVTPFLIGPETNINRYSPFKTSVLTEIFIFFLGGSIHALLKKPGKTYKTTSIKLIFYCPTCKNGPLKYKNNKYVCSRCFVTYQTRNKVIQLLPVKLRHALYD